MTETFSHYKDQTIIFNHIQCHNPSSNHFPLHTHDICEIIFLKEGDVTGMIEGKSYKLYQNDLILFRPHAVHGIRIDSNAVYERYNILFDEKVVANGAYQKISPHLDVIRCQKNNRIKELFQKLDFYYTHFEGEDFKKLVTGLVEELVFNITITTPEHPHNPPHQSNRLMTKAIEYIDKNYTNCLSVEEICSELFISKRHLQHLFMEHLQITPKKYINSKRLLKAQNLLRQGEKACDIYLDCGFRDYGTFYRNYVQKFGHSPSVEYKSEIKREINS